MCDESRAGVRRVKVGKVQGKWKEVDGLDGHDSLKKGKERIWGNSNRACGTKML